MKALTWTVCPDMFVGKGTTAHVHPLSHVEGGSCLQSPCTAGVDLQTPASEQVRLPSSGTMWAL